MIEVKDLSFAYQAEQPVLKDINLTLDQRSTAIIGQNGAGKTTFVKLLKGLLKPTRGDIWVLGKNTKETTVASLAKDIGLVFQNPNEQIFKGRVLDEVKFGPLMVGYEPEQATQQAIAALEMVGLENRFEENPQDLSLSDKKKLCMASVIAMDPKIIILDEPTIAQDEQGKQVIQKVIQMLKEQKKLVLTIIHDMDFVAENFERTILFHQGQVLLDGETREVFAHTDLLKQAYVTPPSITQLAHKLGWQEVILTEDKFVQKYQAFVQERRR